jgi:hypothetical protein
VEGASACVDTALVRVGAADKAGAARVGTSMGPEADNGAVSVGNATGIADVVGRGAPAKSPRAMVCATARYAPDPGAPKRIAAATTVATPFLTRRLKFIGFGN